MGRTKALVRVGGVAMAQHVADTLRSAGCAEVVAYGGDPHELRSLPVPVVAEAHPGEGPVGAVAGVLERFAPTAAGAPSVFVMACDLPGLDAAVLQALLAAGRSHPGADVVVARTSVIEPTCALWNVACAARVREMFDGGERALHAVIGRLDVVCVAVDPAVLRNINTPDDLHRYS
jgi:molybdopterin-guanine dinucleotide biosynthesis protein A